MTKECERYPETRRSTECRVLSIMLVFGLLVMGMGMAASTGKEKLAQAPSGKPAPAALANQANGAYFAADNATTSASLAGHSATGLHAAFVGFGQDNQDTLYYARCMRDCTEDGGWASVELRLPAAVKVQIALTPSGQPRILVVGSSIEFADTSDHYFAECDRSCLDASNWKVGRIVSTLDSLSSTQRARLPERNFALDSEGRPRFVVADTFSPAGPAHYGSFYLSCDVTCTEPGHWTETNLANQYGAETESFIYPVLALGPNGSAHLLASVHAFDTDGANLKDGLYYYECPANCAQRSQWQRTRIIFQGSGSDPSPTWSLAITSDGRPRAALFTGLGVDAEGLDQELLCIYCQETCTSKGGANWFGYVIGVGTGVGESPELKLDSRNMPHVAYTTDVFELGYTTCEFRCEDQDDAAWSAHVGEMAQGASADRPRASPSSCEGHLLHAMSPSLVVSHVSPLIAYDISIEGNCPSKADDELTQRYELWRGARVVQPDLTRPRPL